MGCGCTKEGGTRIIKYEKDKQDKLLHNYSISTNMKSGYNTIIPSVKNNQTHNASFCKNDSNLEGFSIEIEYFKNIIKIIFPPAENKNYILVSDLLNKAIFNSNQFDCNFTSKYNSNTDSFEYTIERLSFMNDYTDIKNSSWSIYINGEQEDLTEIVNEGRVVYLKDNIVLKQEVK